MKLHYIKIADYRILQDFSLEFKNSASGEQKYALDLLVGVNGTGKSTLLRLIASIFQYLEGVTPPPFGFEIRYQLQDSLEGVEGITVFSNLQSNSDERIANDQLLRVSYGMEKNQAQQPVDPIAVRKIEHTELPPLVVAFTTGSEREWKLALDTTQQSADIDNIEANNGYQDLPRPDDPDLSEKLTSWYLQELPGEPVNENVREDDNLSSQRFLFITAEQIPLVILCGMLVDMLYASKSAGAEKTFPWGRLSRVMKESRIKSLRGFSLKFRKNDALLLTQDKDFINGLQRLAHHVIQTGSDFLLVFDLFQSGNTEQAGDDVLSDTLFKLIGSQDGKPGSVTFSGSGIDLFKRLIRLAEPGGRLEPILRDVDVFLEKMPSETNNEQSTDDHTEQKPPLHLLRWLSDGEQSFLGRMCLISLLRDSEALILLDEPEVHFNDYWKRQLVYMLHETLQDQQSHVLMTTHSSITLTDVKRDNIQVLDRKNGYTHRAISPALRTLGADPADIMINVFGAENASGAQSVKYIEDKLRLSESAESNDERKQRLQTLLKDVGPGYWRFLIRREIHALEGKE